MGQPLEAWFEGKGWTPLPFQREVWEHIAAGKSGLLHSSTGSGKTLAVWLGYLQSLRPGLGLRVLWITPLRALASDTLSSLQSALEPFDFDWHVEARTGDTSTSIKQRQLKALPGALVTTPESLSLMLSRPERDQILGNLDFLIVDEWHELLGSKRGAQTELALAHLRRLNPSLMVWGLSATLGNIEQAAKVLIPTESNPLIVRGETEKEVIVDSLLPESVERFPWAGHMGLHIVPQVIRELESCRSALVFTNTRAQAELWFQAILDLKPEWKGKVEIHHGSLDLGVRASVEAGLKQGVLKVVVCTSSLDLGVDFSPVERVFQIGSPKGVARLLQRAGRSGHQPGEVSRVTCVPTHTMELVDIAAARHGLLHHKIEAKPIYRNPLDVLAQHLVTMALGGGFEPDWLLEEVRSTYTFKDLSDAEWQWALHFVTLGGSLLAAYDDFHKVVIQDGKYVVTDKRIALRHRMNIGSIMSDASMQVQFLKGSRLGSVEESFVSRLRRGDVFMFSGRLLEFVMAKDMTCYVRAARSSSRIVPRWAGGRMPLTSELAESAREVLDSATYGSLEGPEMVAAAGILTLQKEWSLIPAEDEVLIEKVRTREGFHCFVFPIEGRLVHEGLAALIAYRIAQHRPQTFSIACNDYGFELLSDEPIEIDEAIDRGAFDPAGVGTDILESLNASEMTKRQFREIARVAGLVQQSAPGLQKSARQLQVSSSLMFDVFARHDPQNPLLKQARKEVLERNLDEVRLVRCLGRLNRSRIRIVEVERPTPFAFPLIVDRLRDSVSSESAATKIEKLARALESAAERAVM